MPGTERSSGPWTYVVTIAATLLLAIIVAQQIFSATDAAREGRDAKIALCILRGDLERRSADTEAFLNEHPNDPEPLGGVPRQTLETSLRSQKETISALSFLDCD